MAKLIGFDKRRKELAQTGLYVLYSPASGLVKVGKAKSLKNRLSFYEKESADNWFSEDEQVGIMLLARVETTNSSHDQRYTLAEKERILIRQAENWFGEAVHGMEWFRVESARRLGEFLKKQHKLLKQHGLFFIV